MRINVYSQELTNEVELISQSSNAGIIYDGVRLYLHSSDKLHHTKDDDDKSAITLWLPSSYRRRIELAETLEKMAKIIRVIPAFANNT